MNLKSQKLPVLLLGGIFFFLSGCQEKHDESYYFTHPEMLKQVLAECQRKGGSPGTFDAPCALAYHTAVRMTRLSQAFITSQTNFGQRILRSQTRAAEIAKQLEVAKKAHLPVGELDKQLAAEERQTNNLRAIVGLFIRI